MGHGRFRLVEVVCQAGQVFQLVILLSIYEVGAGREGGVLDHIFCIRGIHLLLDLSLFRSSKKLYMGCIWSIVCFVLSIHVATYIRISSGEIPASIF